MSQERVKRVCPSGGGGIPTLRNRYFTGKYMTARDFADEQHYLLARQRLHNRLFYGWGIVCGLQIEPHPDPDCQPGWIVVKAGVAIDCYGREIFLPEDTAVEVPLDQLPLPIAEQEEPEQGQEPCVEVTVQSPLHKSPLPLGERAGERGQTGWGTERLHVEPYDDWPQNGLLVCLSYCEEEVEPVPALYAEGSCDPTHHEANRIREVAGIAFQQLSDLPGCWRVPGDWADPPGNDDCDELVLGPGGVRLEPECPCGAWVPLALLVPLPESTPRVPTYEIDPRGRRPLLTEQRARHEPLLQGPQLPFRLPRYSGGVVHHPARIADINWTHGASISVSELRDAMGGELRIRFDREIKAAEGVATGINGRTFTVQFGGITRHLEFLPFRQGHPPYLDDDGCTAVYTLDPVYLRETPWGRENIVEPFVYITLRCDFVLDCHGTPVDGNHLRGSLPSGDGRPGGEFVSWFRVAPSHGLEE